MCVDCVLASSRIAQVDPGDEPLHEMVLSHQGCGKKHCLRCDLDPPSLSMKVIKKLGEQFCMVAPDKLSEAALKSSKIVKKAVRKQVKRLTLMGRSSRASSRQFPTNSFPMESQARRNERGLSPTDNPIMGFNDDDIILCLMLEYLALLVMDLYP
jgi:hypothetical protein